MYKSYYLQTRSNYVIQIKINILRKYVIHINMPKTFSELYFNAQNIN